MRRKGRTSFQLVSWSVEFSTRPQRDEISLHRSTSSKLVLPGFSLIETVLALGILATALMAVIGLLPHALDTSRIADRRAAESLIIANVRAQCTSTLPEGELRFDPSGSPLPDDAHDFAFTAVITADTSLAMPGETIGSVRTARVELRDRSRTWTRTQAFTLPP